MLEEALAYLRLLERHPAARAWLSFTTPDGRRTSHGEPLADCARAADSAAGVVAVGVNCVNPGVVSDAIRALKSGTAKPIVVYPNSGETWNAGDERWHGDAARAGLAALAPGWVAEGAALVGGCCRVGPGQIAALAGAVARLRAPNAG